MQISIYYPQMLIFISLCWLIVRGIVCRRQGRLELRREAMLLLMYICLIVIVRFTFFPFFKVDGVIQPLVFDLSRMLPPRINLVPFVNLTDYPERREIILNIVGNSTMFIPVGIVWPSLFPQLRKVKPGLAAGLGFSLVIEILQLPFFDRVTDIDDLILNSLGYAVGYGIWLFARFLERKLHKSAAIQ